MKRLVCLKLFFLQIQFQFVSNVVTEVVKFLLSAVFAEVGLSAVPTETGVYKAHQKN